jgi:hypothetical protein
MTLIIKKWPKWKEKQTEKIQSKKGHILNFGLKKINF